MTSRRPEVGSLLPAEQRRRDAMHDRAEPWGLEGSIFNPNTDAFWMNHQVLLLETNHVFADHKTRATKTMNQLLNEGKTAAPWTPASKELVQNTSHPTTFRDCGQSCDMFNSGISLSDISTFQCTPAVVEADMVVLQHPVPSKQPEHKYWTTSCFADIFWPLITGALMWWSRIARHSHSGSQRLWCCRSYLNLPLSTPPAAEH